MSSSRGPGQGTNLATEFVVRAPPDGYTLLFVGAPNAINASLYSKSELRFHARHCPGGRIARVPMVLIVHPSVPATTIPEFLAYVRANPKKVNMASSGVGTTPHLAGELFKMMAGVDIQHVPYRGAAPAMTDLLAGQVQILLFHHAVLHRIHPGRPRARYCRDDRKSGWTRFPTCRRSANSSRAIEATAWYGVGAPRETPRPIVERLNREINAVLADPKMKAKFDDLGCVLIGKLARRIRQADCRGNRKVGQGRQVCRRSAPIECKAVNWPAAH